MASAALRREVTCSICKDIYTDPVTLKCGHSFCHGCIEKEFKKQGNKDHFCPECRRKLVNCANLRKDLRLTNIADYFRTLPQMCSFCIQAPIPAVKLCLHCEAFLCDVHEQRHNKSPEHVLTDPTISLEDRKCPVHKRILDYYCTVDDTCICVDCLTSDHNGHKVSTINDSLQKKMQLLNDILEKLSSKREENEATFQNLKDHQRKVDKKADGVAEKITAIMRDLRRQQEDLKKRILVDISRQQQQISEAVSDHIQQVENKYSELHQRFIQTEEMTTNINPSSAIQMTKIVSDVLNDLDDLCRSIRKLLDDADNVEEERILETLHLGLSDIVRDISVQDIQTLFTHCSL